jgi:uncharacterized protein YjdB
VASVDQNGRVTGIAAGSAIVTVRTVDGGFTATCYVSVIVPVSGIVISPAAVSIDVGETYWLTATVEPFNAAITTLAWSTSSADIATVNQAGFVTGVAPGTVTITAAATDGSGVFATATVNVILPIVPVTGVTLNRNTLQLLVGSSDTLIATVLPANATNKNVTWASDSPSVASVDQNGRVTGIAAGSAIVTVRTVDGNFSATCNVSVIIPVSSITISPASVSIGLGTSLYWLVATVTPPNAGNQNLTWSSSNTAIATVNQGGYVSGIALGTVTITATAQDGSGVFGTCIVTVTNTTEESSLEFPGNANLNVALPLIITPVNADEASIAINALAAKMPSLKLSDLYVNKYGVIAVQDSIVNGIVKKLLGLDADGIFTLPIFEAVVKASGNIAVVTFDLKGIDLLADTPDKVALLKVISSENGEFVKYVSNTADFADKTFTIMDMNNSIFTGKIVPADTYKLVVMIKDGGSFDLDGKENGVVIDPLALIQKADKVDPTVETSGVAMDAASEESESSKDGCNVGLGYLAFALIAVALVSKKKSK